ncbi:Uncharacterised protein [Dermatophilus congolensis]|uniref:Uncharacterized protein n=1 Tax=Dermatophilus congolensis TaxID=1863 RepID=A0AA46BMH5_9MICO|nr:hypothetical protein [Dermatophilus congolensis]STD07312.1 Uncharacterised protein [Dermatophilus congolensis]
MLRELESVGRKGPVQATPTSCGAAALVMARALIDPPFAAWLSADDVSGEKPRVGAVGVETPQAARMRAQTAAKRWATAECEVLTRTNAVTPRRGTLQVPWPTSLGTPPWGARAEIERSGSVPGVSYEIRLVRFADKRRRASLFDETVARIGVGRPVLVYVGGTHMPRHVVLWARTEPGKPVLQYDPGTGDVDAPRREGFLTDRCALSGWNVPWLLVRPDPVTIARETGRLALWMPRPSAQSSIAMRS